MIARMTMAALLMTVGMTLTGQAAAQTYVYPSKGQSAQQQQKDEAECHTWASQQSGVNPSQQAPQVVGPTGAGDVVRGGAGGAALGAIGGLIAGHAGEGAAIGAAVGAARGLFQRFGLARQQSEEQSNVDAQHQQGVQDFNNAYNTCLRGRGYTVS